MSEWKEVTLKCVIESANTGLDAIKRAPIVLENTGIKCLRIQDISQSKPYSDWGFTNVEQKNYEKFRLRKGDIIIARTGNTIGVNRFFNEDIASVFNNGLIRLRVKKDIVNPKYIFYNLRSKYFKDFIESISGGTSTQPNMQIEVLLTLDLLIPPLPEQERIAEVLSSLDDKIDLLQRQNKTLEEMAETLFRQWFVEEAEEKWKEIRLGQFITPKKGKNITKSEAIDGLYPVVAGGLEPSCFHNQSNTKAPVITISASGANAGFVKLYYNEVWSSDSSFIDETVTDHIYFFYVLLKLKQSQIFDKQEGSAQPHIYPSHIMNLEAYNYPISLIDKFNQTVNSFFNKISKNIKQIQQLEALRDTLLPKLMSGAINVN